MKTETKWLRDLLWLAGIVTMVFCFSHINAQAQFNSRNWVNIQSSMVGGTVSTMTTTAFSAFNSVTPFKYYSLAVTPQTTTTAYTINLDGSNDQTTWAALATANQGLGASGGIVFQSSAEPVLFLRLSATKMGSGDKITVTAVGAP